MNSILGQVVLGTVTDENDNAYFVQVDGITMYLDKAEIDKPMRVGGKFKGFVYENEDHHLQITRNIPKVQKDHYAFGTVVRTRHDLGVFVDIGLPNKDIVVSLDDLPTLTELWPNTGDRLMIGLKTDNKDRLWGELADEDIFLAMSQPASADQKNSNVEVTAIRLKMAGTRVITDDLVLGFVHPSEQDKEPRLGEHLKARVIGVQPDGRLNLSLKPRAFEAIGDDAQMVLASLQHSTTHTLPFTDKSDPEAIRDYFGISKGQFKRAIGHLLKERLVIQEDGILKLTE